MKNTILFSVLAALMASPAFAQAPTDLPDQLGDDRAGTGYIGISGLISSEYLGSDQTETQVFPYLSLENVKGFDFFGTTLSYRLIETGTGEGLRAWSLRAGPSIGWQSGRDSDDSPTLTGFEDIDGSLPIGGYIRSTVGPVGLRLDAGQDVIGGHDGLRVDASIGTFLPLGKLFIRPSISAHWADNTHNESFFGVSANQAAASGLTQFDASSGIYGYSAGILSWVEFNEKYALTFIGNYRWFTDEATDSPILNAADGSNEGFFAALSLSRKFDTKKW